MSPLIPLLWAAGVIQIGIIVGNAFLPRLLAVPENLPRLTPILREVFIVHWLYILLVLAFWSALCLTFAPDLAGGSPLGRTLSGGLAVFWSLRLVIQLLYYDAATRRRYRAGHLLFSVACAFLAVVFIAAALAGVS